MLCQLSPAQADAIAIANEVAAILDDDSMSPTARATIRINRDGAPEFEDVWVAAMSGLIGERDVDAIPDREWSTLAAKADRIALAA